MKPTLADLIRNFLDHVREATGREALDLLETGSIRSSEIRFRDGDGWSTLELSASVQRYGGTATSIDLDVSMASQVLSEYGRASQVKLMEEHSIDALGRLVQDGRQFDFILLDSDNDAQLTLHEWYLAKRLVRKGGVIMIDDVEPGSKEVVKGNDIIPHLNMHNIPYSMHKRSKNNVTTGVCVVEF